MLGLKIARGMKNMQFEETYDEWSRLLRESGLVHPLWNQEDCEFVRNTLSSKPTTVELFQEIVSFKRQGGWFTYELLGFSHSDIDDVFDWSRVSANILRSTNNSQEHRQSMSSFSHKSCQE